MKITKENKEIINELFQGVDADEIKFIYNSSENLCSNLIKLNESNTSKIVTDISPYNPILGIKKGLVDLFIKKGSYIHTPLSLENNILLIGTKVHALEKTNISSISKKIKISTNIQSDLIKEFRNIFIFTSCQAEIQKILEASNKKSRIFIITNFISNEIYWETDKRNISFIDQTNISLRNIFVKILEIINEPLCANENNSGTSTIELNSLYKNTKLESNEFIIESKTNDNKDTNYNFATILNKKFHFHKILENNFFGSIKNIVNDFDDKNNITIFIKCVDERLVSSDKKKILFLYNYIIWDSQLNKTSVSKIDFDFFAKTFKNKFSYIENDPQITLEFLKELFKNKEEAKNTINKKLYHSFKVMIPELLSSSAEVDNHLKLNDIKVSHFLGDKKSDHLETLCSVFNSVHDIEKRTSPFLNQIYFLINISHLDKFININLTGNKLFSILLYLKYPSTNLHSNLIELYKGSFDNISFKSKPFAFLTYSILNERFGITGGSKNIDLSPDTVFDIFTKRIYNTDNKLLHSPLHCSFLLDYYQRNDLSEFFDLTKSIFENLNYDCESINFYNNLISNSS